MSRSPPRDRHADRAPVPPHTFTFSMRACRSIASRSQTSTTTARSTFCRAARRRADALAQRWPRRFARARCRARTTASSRAGHASATSRRWTTGAVGDERHDAAMPRAPDVKGDVPIVLSASPRPSTFVPPPLPHRRPRSSAPLETPPFVRLRGRAGAALRRDGASSSIGFQAGGCSCVFCWWICPGATGSCRRTPSSAGTARACSRSRE